MASIRDSQVRRLISRIDNFSRKDMRLMIFKNPMWITPSPPVAHCAGGRVTWLNSKWKLSANPAHFRVEINITGVQWPSLRGV